MAIVIKESIPKNKIGLVIFNLDDILLDTSLPFECALQNAIREFYTAIRIEDYYYMDKDYRIPMGFKLMRLKYDIGMPKNIMHKIDWTYENFAIQSIEYMYLSKDAIKCLEEIRKRKQYIAVVSNTRKSLLREIVRVTGLHQYVDFIKCARDADLEGMIPDKHVLEYVCRTFKMPKRNALYIGNSFRDSYMAMQADVYNITVDGPEDINLSLPLNW